VTPDIFDRATEAEEAYREAAIARARAARQSDQESLDECEDCGDPIPEARRLAVPGCRCCVDCQGEREKAQKRSGHANHR